MELSCFCEAFPPQNLRHVLPVHKHIGDQAVVDIAASRDDAHDAVAEQFGQPLLGCLAFRLAQLRCVDAAEPDAVWPGTNGVSIDGGYVQRAQQSEVSEGPCTKRRNSGLFLLGSQLVPAFREPLGAAVRRTPGALLFVGRQAI
jgi:hypothetical protein